MNPNDVSISFLRVMSILLSVCLSFSQSATLLFTPFPFPLSKVSSTSTTPRRLLSNNPRAYCDMPVAYHIEMYMYEEINVFMMWYSTSSLKLPI